MWTALGVVWFCETRLGVWDDGGEHWGLFGSGLILGWVFGMMWWTALGVVWVCETRLGVWDDGGQHWGLFGSVRLGWVFGMMVVKTCDKASSGQGQQLVMVFWDIS